MKVKVLKKFLNQALQLIEQLEDTKVIKRAKDAEFISLVYANLICGVKKKNQQMAMYIGELERKAENLELQKLYMIKDIEKIINKRKGKIFNSKISVGELQSIVSRYSLPIDK